MTVDRREIDLQSDTLFRLLIETVHEYAIFMLDPGGHVRTWNRGAERIKGYRASEIIGQHFGRFYPAGTSREKLDWELQHAIEHGHFEEEGWRIRKDGTRFWANVVITPLFHPSGELLGFAKVTRDLTDRLRHEHEREELIAKEARAKAETAARDAFLSVAAHELKTPITTTKAAVQLLQRSFRQRQESLDPAQKRSLALLDEQMEKLSLLVGRLLETVRIQGGRLTLETERADLTALVRSILDRIGHSAQQELVLQAPPSLVADVDTLRFEQVVVNLVSNALKFGPPDQAVVVTLEQRPPSAILTVFDRGPGVPEADRPRLFERFFQANPSRSGMGLGLFIAKEIVEAHGGTISVDFPEGGGTLFTVTIPA
jgi:PAS domain S-box-containing protein